MRSRDRKRVMAYLLCIALAFENAGITALAEEMQANAADEQVVCSEDAAGEEDISGGDVSNEDAVGDDNAKGNVAVSQGDVNAVGVSDNDVVCDDDMAVNESMSENTEITSETENIASGTYYGIDWVISGDGLLTISGEYDELSDYGTSWNDYNDSVRSAKVTATRVTSTSSWFKDMTNLQSIDLSGFDMAEVTYANYMLKGCTALETIISPKNLGLLVNLPGIYADDEQDIYATSPQNMSKAVSLHKISNLAGSGYRYGMYWAQGEDGNLIIAGEYDKNGGGSGWPINCVNAKVIATGVTSTDGWFMNCSSLQSVDLTEFDASQITDMSLMFLYCKSLVSLELGDLNTGNVTDMSSMFSGCSSLSSLDLSGFDMTRVEDTDDMLRGCTGLLTVKTPVNLSMEICLPNVFADDNGTVMIQIPQNEAASVTLSKVADALVSESERGLYWIISGEGQLIISGKYKDNPDYVFYPGWSSYSDDVISVIITASGVMSTKGWFSGMKYLSNVDFSKFDTSQVTDMSYMFHNCDALTVLDLSGMDTSQVTSMRHMFSESDNLESINLSGLNAGRVTDMSEMFSYCKKLTSLNLNGIDTSRVENMSRMFLDCESLSSLDLSSLDTGNVTNMYDMFAMCYNLISLDLSELDTGRVTNMDGMFCMPEMENKESKLTDLNLSGLNTSQVTNMSSMFSGCSRLSSLDVSKFDTSQVTDMSYMFENCSNLTSLDVSNFDTSRVMDMSYMFYHCYGLTDLNLAEIDTSQVTNMSYMFYMCCNLTGLDLKSFDTRQVTDMSHMFEKCGSLNRWGLDLSNFDTRQVTNMEGMFSWASVTSLDLKSFDTSQVTNTKRMFYWCNNLTSLDLSSFDMSKVESASSMLYNCSGLKEIMTPKNLSLDVVLPGVYLDEKQAVYTSMPMNRAESISLQKDESLIGAGKYYGMDWVIDNDGNLTISGEYDESDEGLSWRNFQQEIIKTKVTVTGAKNTKSWFEWLSDMESIELEGLDTSQVVDMSNMFEGCCSLGNLDLRCLDTSQVTSMYGMFEWCQSGLTSLDVSNFDTSNVTDMSYMFYVCSGLTSLDLSSFDMSKVETAKDMLTDCSKLETIKTPKNLNLTVELPTTMYDESGNIYTSLPMGSSVSITLTARTFGGDNDENNDNTDTNEGGDNTGDTGTGALVVSAVPDQTYTGMAINPSVTVSCGNRILVVDRDYTISYKNNINAADKTATKAPTITIKGKGNYTGTISVKFNILPRDLKTKTSYTRTIVSANGKVQKANPTVKVEGKKLALNKDYTIEYPDSTDGAYKNPGTYNIVIKGMGNFQGSLTTTMSILDDNQVMASKLTVSKIPSCTYVDGETATPSVTVSYKGKVLEPDKDYSISYFNNDRAGKASVLITGLENTEGTYVVGATARGFTIKGTDLKKANVTYNTSAIYSGLEICPAVTLTLGTTTLRPGKDYTVEYTGNINVGKGTIILTGCGGYTGVVKKTFTIQADASVSEKLNVTFKAGKAEAAYNQSGAKPAINVALGDTQLVLGRDYTISYKNNKKLAAADGSKAPTVVIKGKGNYKFTKEIPFSIVEKSLSDQDISVVSADKFVGDKKGYLSAPVVTDANGKKLKAGKDYKVVGYTVNGAAFDGKEAPAGTTVTVTVEGMGNYVGQATATYRVASKNISNTKTNSPKVEYNGGRVVFTEKMLGDGVLTITDKSANRTLVYGTDYIIAGYKNNNRTGTAQVTIQGIGEYGGTKVVKFSIVSKKLK